MKACSCFLADQEGEGFGLTLIVNWLLPENAARPVEGVEPDGCEPEVSGVFCSGVAWES